MKKIVIHTRYAIKQIDQTSFELQATPSGMPIFHSDFLNHLASTGMDRSAQDDLAEDVIKQTLIIE